jgi:TPP-dependent pyruvate/acetoin dehydrogenase alpha subunit
MHIFDAATRFFGGNAIVGGGLPLAVGIALADKRLKRGAVTACFFGEGAVGEGVFHESLNLAQLWRLPVLFVCENNLYAMGVPLADSEAQPEIWKKAQAYRMAAEAVDGMDPVAVEVAAHRAVERIRSGAGPVFLECRTYRFRAHSMFDTQAYRKREEVEQWKQHDPIDKLRRWLLENHRITGEELTKLEEQVDVEVAAAVAFAEAGTLEPVAELERYVTMDRVPQEEAARAAAGT